MTTLRELIDNPSGPGTRHVAPRYLARDALDKQFLDSMKDPDQRRRYSHTVFPEGAGKFLAWVAAAGVLLLALEWFIRRRKGLS